MITDIVDIKGEQLNVGDLVAYGDTTSSYNSVICYGKIVNIQKKNLQTHIIVKTIKNGGWQYYNDKFVTFIYPRNYHNLIKLTPLHIKI